MIPTVLLLATLLLAGMFLFSGVLKWRDREGSQAAVRGFGVVPEGLVAPVSRTLPGVEIALGLLLLSTWGRPHAVVAGAALLLLLGFTVLVGRALARGEDVACHCFGAASTEPVSRGTLIRNLVLVSLALAVLLGVVLGGSRGPWPTVADWGSVPLTLLAAVVVAGVLAGLLAVRVGLLRARLAQEREEADQAIAEAQASGTPAEPTRIPPISVLSRDGAVVSLPNLAAQRAKLVISVSPSCGACKNLQPAFAHWRQGLATELDVIVLSRSSMEAAEEHYGDEGEWLYADPDGAAANALGIGGTPGAVLLGTNGTVAAGPALGKENILELIAAVIQAIGVNVMTGQSHQSQEERSFGGSDQGQEYLPALDSEVEDIAVLDETGAATTLHRALAELGESSVPVVTWRDSCPYCGEVVEELAQFSERGEVVLLINEPIETVRAQGLTGPVLQTQGADASAALRLPGTPAGYPIGAGRVEAGGGVGGGSILRMLVERARERGTLVETEVLSAMERQQAHARGEHDHPHDHAHPHDHGAENAEVLGEIVEDSGRR